MAVCLVSTVIRIHPASADAIADKRAQAAQLTAQIASEMQRMDVLSNEYDAAKLRVSSLDQQVADAQAALQKTQQHVGSLKALLRKQAVAAFMEGDSVSSLDVVLSSTAKTLELRQNYLETAAGSNQDTIDSLHIAEQQLQVRQAALTSARVQASDAMTQVSVAESQASAEASQQQSTLSQVKGQLATLVQQQQQAQAAAQAQQVQARIAAQQQAQQAAASRQTTALHALAAASAGGGGHGGGGGGGPGPTTFAFSAPPPPPPPSGSGGAAAVAAAESYMGVPYVWGGASRAGVDCSGLTMLAWEAAGVSLPHYTVAQWDATTHVPLSALQPGDLVFYGSGISHVAMYVGGGSVIEALTTGTVVGIYSIGYAGSPIGAGRP
jgi:cell wall-associated NlpC family hydrolase